ncbi:hypothetical protein TNCT_541361 [Trichonephila clavata]|uniref:Uncharacterized protein n=1 Tax=Trichonephila clavata TaxID=2740835 RepID=A0A8X6H193_TRICU|nr:hypothetical protein TNCT_541361 [Trichonephila clavata]
MAFHLYHGSVSMTQPGIDSNWFWRLFRKFTTTLTNNAEIPASKIINQLPRKSPELLESTDIEGIFLMVGNTKTGFYENSLNGVEEDV